MSYIRAKNRIEEVSIAKPLSSQEKNELLEMLFECKAADTIEKLCDEFVVAYTDKNHIVYNDLEWAKDKAKRSDTNYKIYGAIWTEWGLKYVAKLNENEEWVLL